jgi:hypothetical protein
MEWMEGPKTQTQFILRLDNQVQVKRVKKLSSIFFRAKEAIYSSSNGMFSAGATSTG